MSPLAKKLRRFFFIRTCAGRVMHRVYKTRGMPVEGDLTQCGIFVRPKWQWITPVAGRLPKCKRCENAAC